MEGHHQVMKVGGSRSSNSSSSSLTVQYDHDHDDLDLQSSEEDQMMMMTELRRGPWTVEEDLTLMNYIANHGEGRWNSLARCAGLKRTGKSCRLRWLNYLRPDVRRGNITLEEQLLILDLHSRWGNRWSKIAQHLPGRTDNEIKNYWRTRVQKHAKQLKCDVNSKQFKDTVRYMWMPRLIERIQAASGGPGASTTTTRVVVGTGPTNTTPDMVGPASDSAVAVRTLINTIGHHHHHYGASANYPPANSSTAASSDSFGPQVVSPVSDLTTDRYSYNYNSATAVNPNNSCNYNPDQGQYNSYLFQGCNDQTTIINNNNNNNNGVCHYSNGFANNQGFVDFQATLDNNNNQWWDQSEMSLWNNADDFCFLQQQLNNTV